MFSKLRAILFITMASALARAQQFDRLPVGDLFKADKKIQFREIWVTSKGDMIITSTMEFAEIFGGEFTMQMPMGGLTDRNGVPSKIIGHDIFNDAYYLHTGFKGITGNSEDILYLLSDNNNLGWMDYKSGSGFSKPPFNFPGKQKMDIRKIWLDPAGDLFIAAADTVYLIEEAARLFKPGTANLNYSYIESDSNTVVTVGAKKIRKFTLGKNIIPYCFFTEPSEATITYIGTNRGIYKYEKKTGYSISLFSVDDKELTVTSIYSNSSSINIWFSTLEKGMGYYDGFSKTTDYYPYKRQSSSPNPIQNFWPLSSREFLVAPVDSLPAVFNTETFEYEFIRDTSFYHSKNSVTDIKIGAGNLTVLIKGGDLYISKDFLKNRGVKNSSYPVEPYLKEIIVLGKPFRERLNYELRNDSIKKIRLKYFENHIDFMYAARGVNSSDTIVFAWKLDGLWENWQVVPLSMLDDRMNFLNFDLKPGMYVLHVKMKVNNSGWLKKELELTIIIDPPFWKTWWFWTSVILGISLLIFFIVKWRVQAVRKNEREKARHEKELLEMEARALRAQMNPHFIFNCMNSIKALIQNDDKQRATDYLTTFSKLIRTLFQNSDKRQISLYDEIETCRLYTQLEAMRLDGKLTYRFEIDQDLDLKSVMVPALIIQPFIENAIWHGIVPKEQGNISVKVYQENESVICEIDDDGIGRRVSKQNKAISSVAHESRGVHLSQARLNLEKILNDSKASIDIVDKYEDGKATGTKVIIQFSIG